MSRRLEGKRAVVTGAGSGMGSAIAIRLAAEGARVVCFDRSGAEAEVARQIGDAAIAVGGDVTDSAAVEAAVAAATERFGGLEIFVNNAGISGQAAPITETTDEMYDAVMDTNLRGVFIGMRAAIPAIRAGGAGGAIVNNASVASFRASPNLSVYAASKAAIVRMTGSVAKEVGPEGIRVNAICPGSIDTPMFSQWASEEAYERVRTTTPLGRLGTPEEIAASVAFLVSDDAGYITGTALLADGGTLA